MTTPRLDLARLKEAVHGCRMLRAEGAVSQVIGLTVEVRGLRSRVGELCYLLPQGGGDGVPAEVVGFTSESALLMPLGDTHGIQPGTRVLPTDDTFMIPVGHDLLGRVFDGLGRPLDGRGPIRAEATYPTSNDAPHPLMRKPIREPLVTGVRAIDGFLTLGKGQRIGIFAGSGVGKSTLLGTIARSARADVSVVALIGERGREVQEFIERDLGPEGMRRAVVVASTSDQPALVRLKGAWTATAMAEYFRDQGLDVILMMDSVTRFAMAQREIGLAIGEPPARKGYTPSVFALLPKLMERAGMSARGSITGLYTVLVEGDEFNEPISDAARSILDGHVMLTRELAAENHYPAIDVLQSVSRLMDSIVAPEHRAAAAAVREVLAVYGKARDLINIGAYQAGSSPEIDQAIELMPHITDFLRQDRTFHAFDETVGRLLDIRPKQATAQVAAPAAATGR
ncbi:MAG TPA: FliI/YscN family ATPase [Chloroflexi bacterium]|jgi:flagellum-specific ATP synthase|nr:FliI/YscN family ATPase [Chloroflexota bacterium]